MKVLPVEDSSAESLNFVLNFIKVHGYLYEDQIKDCLNESKKNDEMEMKSIVNRRRSMYDRLAKL